MLRFMLVEQVLHIMQNQDYLRSLCFFRPQKYIFLHYAILGKMENMEKKLYKRLQSHRLNPLNNARLHNLSTCHLYLAKIITGLCFEAPRYI